MLISPTRKTTFKNYNQTFKKKGNYFVCGKLRHHAVTCYKRHKKTKENPSKANLVEGEVVTSTIVVSQVNMVVGNNDCVVDSVPSIFVVIEVSSIIMCQ